MQKKDVIVKVRKKRVKSAKRYLACSRDPLKPSTHDVVDSVGTSINQHYSRVFREFANLADYVAHHPGLPIPFEMVRLYHLKVNASRRSLFESLTSKLKFALSFGPFSDRREIINTLIRRYSLPGSDVGRKEDRDKFDLLITGLSNEDRMKMKVTDVMVLKKFEIYDSMLMFKTMELLDNLVEEQTLPEFNLNKWIHNCGGKAFEFLYILDLMRVIYSEMIERYDIHVYGFSIPGFNLLERYIKTEDRLQLEEESKTSLTRILTNKYLLA